ncbi:MAG TPA: SPFH domain-containing protein [Chloroflexota bacterium]|nr:SPFH domain-containing protein [Chloroflexota bacterium]
MSVLNPVVIVLILFLIVVFFSSLRMCSEWQRKVVLRLGRFAGVRGPGVFFLLPFVETTPFTMDLRVNTHLFAAEQTLTKDGASVTVDAIVYWRIIDAGLAAIRVTNYTQAVLGAAQGALRDIIGRNDLATLLSQRRELDEQLTVILDEQTEPWGIKVESVQLQDIKVPDSLQDALSRMAQAERERQARVILGESEVRVAQLFAEAGEVYNQHPTALHLRGMNMLYETMRNGGANVIMVPSSALDTMNLGVIGGIAGLAQAAQSAPGAQDGQPSEPVSQPPPSFPPPSFPPSSFPPPSSGPLT